MRFLRRQKNQQPDWKSNLHSIDGFQQILQCERMRSDRSGIRFTVVAFTIDAEDSKACEEFVQHLKQRMCATDHIGLLGPMEIGIVLWDTLEPARNAISRPAEADRAARCVKATQIYDYPKLNNRQADQERSRLEQTSDFEVVTHFARPIETKALEVLFTRKLKAWKRMLDLAGASFGLIALSPLLLLIAVLIKLTSKGPILFKQERDGLGGRRFVIYKFRTMRQDAERLKAELRKFSEQDGPAFKLTHDPRVTTLGRFLRKSCMDELPQLWNIIKGDMTLVGPRPLDSKEAENIKSWGRRRLEITPGLTCIWQVHGKSKVQFNEWMRMDIRYIAQQNIKRDLTLIWETIVAVLTHRASV